MVLQSTANSRTPRLNAPAQCPPPVFSRTPLSMRSRRSSGGKRHAYSASGHTGHELPARRYGILSEPRRRSSNPRSLATPPPTGRFELSGGSGLDPRMRAELTHLPRAACSVPSAATPAAVLGLATLACAMLRRLCGRCAPGLNARRGPRCHGRDRRNRPPAPCPSSPGRPVHTSDAAPADRASASRRRSAHPGLTPHASAA